MYDGIPYQVKQRAGDRGITAENMEKSQHIDINEDTTNVFYVSTFYFILWAAVSAAYSALLSSSYFEQINDDDDDDEEQMCFESRFK